MEQTLESYLKSISEIDIEDVEDIICRKYSEFYSFYYALKDYCNDIDTLRYDGDVVDGLQMLIKFKDVTDIYDLFDALKVSVRELQVTRPTKNVKIKLSTDHKNNIIKLYIRDMSE